MTSFDDGEEEFEVPVQPLPELSDAERIEKSFNEPQGVIPTSSRPKNRSRKVRSKKKGDYKPWQEDARSRMNRRSLVEEDW